GRLALERGKVEEQRIDDDRRDEDHEYDDRQRRQPEPEPPAAGAAAQDPVQHPHDRHEDRERDQVRLDPVPEPRAPALNGLVVPNRKMVPPRLDREKDGDLIDHEKEGGVKRSAWTNRRRERRSARFRKRGAIASAISPASAVTSHAKPTKCRR